MMLQVSVQAKQCRVEIRDGENKLVIEDGAIMEYNDKDIGGGGCDRSIDEVLRGYDLSSEFLFGLIVMMTL